MPIYNRENKFLDIYNGSQYLHTIYHKESGDKSIIPWTYEMTTTTSNGYDNQPGVPTTGSLSPSIQFSQWDFRTFLASFPIGPGGSALMELHFHGAESSTCFSRVQLYRIDNSENNYLAVDLVPSDFDYAWNTSFGSNTFIAKDFLANPFANETRKWRLLIYE